MVDIILAPHLIKYESPGKIALSAIPRRILKAIICCHVVMKAVHKVITPNATVTPVLVSLLTRDISHLGIPSPLA